MKPKYKEYFLGGAIDAGQQFVQDNQEAISQGMDQAKGLRGKLRAFGRKRPGLVKGLGAIGGTLLTGGLGGGAMAMNLIDAIRRKRGTLGNQTGSAQAQRKVNYQDPGTPNTGVKPSFGQGGVVKYRGGGMIYGEDSASVTLPDKSAEKEKTFVESNYGTGENRITEQDIKNRRSLDPYEEYGPYVIPRSHYGRKRQAVGFHPKRMTTPGYFLMEGYTDEQRMKDIEAGKKNLDRQNYILEIMPDGSRRVVPFDQIREQFTTGVEGEGVADILEAMDIGVNRFEGGFSLPSREEQIRTLMKRRENYGLGDITFKELQKELGLNVPELKPGEYAKMVEKALKDRAQGARQ